MEAKDGQTDVTDHQEHGLEHDQGHPTDSGHMGTTKHVVEEERTDNIKQHDKRDQVEVPARNFTGKQQQPLKELETALGLLGKADDTSRFVGLALLKPVLEHALSQENNKGEELETLILRSWKAIPSKFLDGLLKAKPNEKTPKEDVQNMVALAVAVLNAFMRLLGSHQTDTKFIGRVPLLVPILRSCDPETRTQIMDILHSVIMTPEGSLAVFRTDSTAANDDQKPSSYLFVTMLLVDIRATIPSLQEKLHSKDYSAISARLARAYDIVSAFVVYLVQSLEKMLDDESSKRTSTAPIPVDLLLRLRTNISESMSLTIEYLRDRYDSSTAGAAGLHPDARSADGVGSSNPLPIAWETSSGMFTDPLTLAQLSCLSLWLRDEENDALRKEATGVMDVLLALYQHGEDRKAFEEHEKQGQDGHRIFRSTVLVALEGIIETPEGVEVFLHEEGWNLLSEDLVAIATAPKDHLQGIEIVRVLLAVLESGFAGATKEEWMALVDLADKALASTAEDGDLEFGIAVSQIAVELLVRAPRGIRNKNREVAQALLKRAEALSMKDHVDEGIEDGLEEVVEGLESLDLGQ
ncbi:hypothetical protein P7C71_g2717, partial [Lecanoromycetidae sp. Uapishka_2]